MERKDISFRSVEEIMHHITKLPRYDQQLIRDIHFKARHSNYIVALDEGREVQFKIIQSQLRKQLMTGQVNYRVGSEFLTADQLRVLAESFAKDPKTPLYANHLIGTIVNDIRKGFLVESNSIARFNELYNSMQKNSTVPGEINVCGNEGSEMRQYIKRIVNFAFKRKLINEEITIENMQKLRSAYSVGNVVNLDGLRKKVYRQFSNSDYYTSDLKKVKRSFTLLETFLTRADPAKYEFHNPYIARPKNGLESKIA